MSQELEQLSSHLRQLSEELAIERQARMDERKKGVSILSIHVPILLTLSLVGGLIAFGIGAGSFYHDVRSHIDSSELHADKKKVWIEGGIAYSNEVDRKIESRASDLEAAIRRNSRAVRQGAECHNITGSKPRSQICSFPDPEKLPLR